jgi:seryl-tRNA synthetase
VGKWTGPERETLAEASALWHKYFALTKELKKFLDREDIETFADLIAQRGSLIDQMKALPENSYRETEECKTFIAQIRPIDQEVMYRARVWLNRSKHRNAAVRSYDLTGGIGPGVLFSKRY